VQWGDPRTRCHAKPRGRGDAGGPEAAPSNPRVRGGAAEERCHYCGGQYKSHHGLHSSQLIEQTDIVDLIVRCLLDLAEVANCCTSAHRHRQRHSLKIIGWPAGTIKLLFSKLNSISCEQVGRRSLQDRCNIGVVAAIQA